MSVCCDPLRPTAAGEADESQAMRHPVAEWKGSGVSLPTECVLAASGLQHDGNADSDSPPPIPQLSLAQFLKRCLALPYYHEISDRIGSSGDDTAPEVVLQQLAKERAAIQSIACIPPSDVKAFLSSLLT